MSYKTILAYVANETGMTRTLNTALPIVQKFDAHFIGLHVIPRIPITYGLMATAISQPIVKEQEERLQEQADKLKEDFYGRCQKAAVKAEWRCNKVGYDDVVSDIVGQSLCADLIVIGQEGRDAYGTNNELSSRIVIEAGRPVLIIPYAGNFETVGEHVVVAWNGSREAARAAFDAVPFMKNAKSVRIVAIDPQCREAYDSIALGDEMALCLSRHGIKAEVTVTRNAAVPVGDALLNRLADDDCDLLVMGCYGHSRLREALFGGATESLLARMTAPVLMCH